MKRLMWPLVLSMVIFCLTASTSVAADTDLQYLNQDHDSCLVELTGDVNVSGAITSADIIYTIKFVFMRGNQPEPCSGVGDVNCSGSVTTADVIYLVNHVFKSGPQPCDFCTNGTGQGCIQ